MTFLVLLFGLGMLTILLALYFWILFEQGRKMAKSRRLEDSLWTATRKWVYVICFGSLSFFALPFSPILIFGIYLAVITMHLQPLLIGFWFENSNLRTHRRSRFNKNVDDWLGEWEGLPDLREDSSSA